MYRLCKIGKFILGSFIIFILIILLFLPGLTIHAAAIDEETVLNDLKQDPNFNTEDYPDVSTDYSLQVIQLAETKENTLVVYVYQPSDKSIDLLGTKISISYGYSMNGEGLSPKLYDMTLVSSNGVFDKYLIKDFPVPGDSKRYYNIVEIFRSANNVIDEIDPAFPTTDKAFAVGQQWFICDLNDSKYYEMNTFNTALITTVWNDFFTFTDGLTWLDVIGRDNPIDCWFYCFNLEEYKATRIFDATLNYSIKHIRESKTVSGFTFDITTTESNDRQNLTKKLKSEGEEKFFSYAPNTFGAPDLKWKRILSSSEFVKITEQQGVNIDSSVREKVLESQWVFTYLETDRKKVEYPAAGNATTGIPYDLDYEDVYDVGTLQIHFQDISGKEYDLGVVNDLTDPDNIAGGNTKVFDEFWDNFVKIISIILGLILLVVLLNFFPPIKIIIELVLKAVIYVLLLPFKLLKWVFNRK